MANHRSKKHQVVTTVQLSVPAEGFIGDPPQQCLVTAILDQAGHPVTISVTGWRSSDPAIAAVDIHGSLVDLTEGDVEVQAQVDGRWWS